MTRMTKQDFEGLADALAAILALSPQHPVAAIYSINALATVCVRSNPDFEYFKFRRRVMTTFMRLAQLPRIELSKQLEHMIEELDDHLDAMGIQR